MSAVGGKGGLSPEDIIRKVLGTALERAPKAIETVCELMEHASRDSVRLDAALKVLEMAGVPMQPEVAVTLNQPQTNPYAGKPTAALLREASVSTTLQQ